MRARKTALFLVGSALFLCAIILSFALARRLYNESGIEISLDSGIYYGRQEIEIKKNNVTEAYYAVLDGTLPELERLTLFETPIGLEPSKDGVAYRVLFAYRDKEGEELKLLYRDYLVLDAERDITTDYVVSLWGDENELFSYEEGILVRGKIFDDFMAENPDVNILGDPIPANYYSDEEKAIHASVFTANGEEIVSQNCGLKVMGQYSRAKNQKSLRLYARYDYDEKNEFTYPFFDAEVKDYKGNNVEDFHTLNLHNSGNDNGYAFIRNAICNDLSRVAGFEQATASRATTVWINGRYMGVYWLQNNYDKRYFSESYGDYEGSFVVSEGTLSTMHSDEADEAIKRQSAKDYNELCEWLKNADLKEESDFNYFSERVDVDNLIKYVAIEFYINNTDWIHNNVKVFRYLPAETEELIPETVFDGRYRYLLYDMDYGLGLKTFGFFGRDASTGYLENILDSQTNAMLTSKVFEREDCQSELIKEVLLLANGAFYPDNAIHMLDAKAGTQWQELQYMMNETDILKNSLWESDDNSIDNVIEERQKIKTFLSERPGRILGELDEYFDCGSIVNIVLEDDNEINILIDGLSDSAGICVKNIPVELSCDTKGVRINGWVINGEYISGSVAKLLPSEYASSKGIIEVRAEWEYETSGALTIEAYSTKGENDYVIIKNEGLVAASLSDYGISDREAEPLRAILPDIKLEPGETLTIYGEKYSKAKESGSFQVDFSWGKDEKIVLAHKLDGIIDEK